MQLVVVVVEPPRRYMLFSSVSMCGAFCVSVLVVIIEAVVSVLWVVSWLIVLSFWWVFWIWK